MVVLLSTVFVASLLGSLHCVGMCGPFALLASSVDDSRRKAIIPTAAYSFGRLVAYSIVGAIFGSLGLALNASTSINEWQQTATYVAGALMILVGAIALARCCGVVIKLPEFMSPIQKLVQSGFQRTKMMQPVTRAFTIGALASLMPCGWLYTFAITAAGTGSPLWGAVLMATFWAGTVPIMAALTIGFDKISIRFQKRIPAMMASIVIVVGLFTIFYRAPVVIAGEDFAVVNGEKTLVEQVNQIDHSKLPCCCGGADDR